jgi:hypothetical protein
MVALLERAMQVVHYTNLGLPSHYALNMKHTTCTIIRGSTEKSLELVND